MRRALWTGIAAWSFVVAAGTARAGVADALRALSGGARVKVAWTRSAGGQSGEWRQGSDQTLWGFDTDAGGEAVIQSTEGNYTNPLVTRDGARVVFTDQNAVACYAIAFDGSGTRAQISSGIAGCLWYDASSGTEYAIVVKGATAGTSGDGVLNPIYRVNIDDPADELEIMSVAEYPTSWQGKRGTNPEWLSISADGARLCGDWPWNEVAQITLSDLGYHPVDWACWPSMPYDNSYRTIMLGGMHDEIRILTGWAFDTTEQTISLDGDILVPPDQQAENLRMSSYDPEFLTLTAPAWTGEFGDVYVGKIEFSITPSAQWVRVTDQDADGPSDVWIAPPTTDVRVDSFTASATTIDPGEAVTLSWATTNATAVSVSGGVISTALSGNEDVTPSATTTYVLTASGPGGPKNASVTVTVSTASAGTTVCHEPFAYAPAGASVEAVTPGGTGWAGGYAAYPGRSAGVVGDGLSYSTLPATGGGWTNLGGWCQDARSLSQSYGVGGGASGETFWISWLVRAEFDPADASNAGQGIALYDGPTPRLHVNKRSGMTTWGYFDGDGATATTLWGDTAVAITQDETYLFVAKAVFAPGACALTLWIDPPLASEPTGATACALDVALADWKFDTVHRMNISSSGDGCTIDEFRIGTTWEACVGSGGAVAVTLSVDAGSDASYDIAQPVWLDATVAGDAPLTYAWSVVSGPGAVAFDDASAVDTGATFAAAGEYVLRLDVTDADESGSDAVAITVTESGTPVLDLLSPDGGEVMYVGQTRHVVWTAANLDNAKILYRRGGGAWEFVEPSLLISDPAWGSFPWVVPDTPHAACDLYISGYFDEAPDQTTSSFEIRAVTDLDLDGMDDAWEAGNFSGDPDGTLDADGDGLSDLEEFLNATDPNLTDTDADGLDDAWEVEHAFDPLTDSAGGDPDGDGHDNAAEFAGGTDPRDAASVPGNVQPDDGPLSCAPRAGGAPGSATTALLLSALATVALLSRRGPTSRHALEQALVHLLQERGDRAPVRRAEATREHGAHLARGVADAPPQAPPFRRGANDVGPAVARVGLALDESPLDQGLHRARRAGLVDEE